MKICLIQIFLIAKVNAQIKTIINLSALDCATCTLNLSNILNLYPETTIYISKEYEEDSLGIYAKFNLDNFRKNIVWHEVGINNNLKNKFSQFVVTKNESIIYQKKINEVNFTEITNLARYSNCAYKLPKKYNAKDYKYGTIVKNYISNKQYIINDSIPKEIILDSIIVKNIYSDSLGLSNDYQIYAKAQKSNSIFNPKILSLSIDDDGIINYVLLLYKLESIKDNDSTFEKVLVFVQQNQQNIVSAKLINTSGLDKNYSINEYNIYYYNEMLYCGILSKNTLNRSYDNFKILSEFKKTDKEYIFSRIQNFTLPKYIIDYKIDYNVSDFLTSSKYLTTTFNNFIYDIKNGNSIKIPLSDTVFQLNSKFMDTFISNYSIDDMKYSKESNIFSILYEINKVKYVSHFKKGANEFTKTIKICDINSCNSEFKSLQLSHDAKYLIFSNDNYTCLQYRKLEE